MKPDSSRTVYDGKLIDVTLERWGEHEREIVEHPGAVAIVAIDRDRSYRLTACTPLSTRLRTSGASR